MKDSTKRWLSWGVLAFTVLVWLNQSMPLHAWEALQKRVFVSGTATTLETVRYPFTFLYRRAADEELFFNLSGAMLGEAIDRPMVEKAREGSPAAFIAPLPPADRRFHPPYSDVPVEYPPLLVPFVLVPRLMTSSLRIYCHIFGALMGLCLIGATAALVRVRKLPAGVSVLWVLFALHAHGAIVIQRLDALTALLLALCAAAWVGEHKHRAAIFLGLAGASKFLPIVLILPLMALDASMLHELLTAHGESRKAAFGRCIRFGGIAIGTFALGLVPFYFFSSHALGDVLEYHGKRGLHGESVLGAFCALGSLLNGTASPADHSFGSFNIAGPGADLCAKASMPLLLLAMLGVSAALLRFHRRAGSSAQQGEQAPPVEVVVLLCLALVWACGKVFSPQYLTWAIPFMPLLVREKAHVAAISLLALMGISQLYFRGYFDAVYMLEPLGVWTLVARNVILFVVIAALTRRLWHWHQPKRAVV
jgi:hypothetical protein